MSGAAGLGEPLERGLERRLRQIVLVHAGAERRTRYPAILHVGSPAGAELVWAAAGDDPGDHTLRTDVLAAMVKRVRGEDAPTPLVWLTRSGDLDTQDVDARWLAAARAAYAEAELPLVMVVANRHGWVDPRSGLRRSWVRLRQPRR